MIGVTIHINGQTILARTAVNTGEQHEAQTVYRTDAGDEVLHAPEDGAVVLAIIDILDRSEPVIEEK